MYMYCGEKLWMELMDIYEGLTCAIGKSPVYGSYRKVSIFSLVAEQIWSVLLTGPASMNIQEWVITNKACDTLHLLFMTGDPPCWNERLCGQNTGEPPMVGPDITLSPGFWVTRQSIPNNGVRVSELLPEIIAYHRNQNMQVLNLMRI
jgi:hypothetical protein